MIEDLLTSEAIFQMRDEIDKKNGIEIFFVGKTDPQSNRISEIKPCAWGNNHAVPVVFQEAYKGDYLIHNHPSGNLLPSDNDISLASHFAGQGIGFLIIDNDVTEHNTVVPAVNLIETTYLKTDELCAILEPDGPISKKLKEYEYRKGQVEMLAGICETFNENAVAVIEAGTGTGKSLAYLIPSIFWAISNKEKIVISTNTINLQEQLVIKDIPFIKKTLNIDFKAVLVKGRQNYACLKRIAMLDSAEELFEDDILNFRNTITEWAKTAKNGTKDEIGFLPEADAWEKVSSDKDYCIKAKCAFFQQCFFFKARKEMAQANILVVNHHILCSDVSIRKSKEDYTTTALLPAFTKVIIDEAHNIEDAVSDFFGTQVSAYALFHTVSRIYKSGKKKSTGVLAYIEKHLTRLGMKFQHIQLLDKALQVVRSVYPQMVEAPPEIDQFFAALLQFYKLRTKPGENQMRLIPALHESSDYNALISRSKPCVSALRSIAGGLSRIHKALDDLNYVYREGILGEIHELESYIIRLNGYADAIEEILTCSDKDKVFWLDYLTGGRGREKVILHGSPIEVGDLMKEYLFSRIDSVVLTSATLSAGGNFDFIKSRIGLDKISEKDVFEKILTSHFNFPEQAVLCIPKTISDPSSTESFEEDFCRYAREILNVTRGATFFLCTSFGQINKLKQFFQNQDTLIELNIFAQGDMERSELLKRFKMLPNSVLLGTDSFWEGVDVPGDDLKCVVIVKLPFKSPSDPVYQARAEKLTEKGYNAFYSYSVPLSAIKFKQGFGRLIRSSYDEGVVVCLDKRIATKNYGRYFIQSLPEIPIVYGEEDEIIHSISKFFR